jgi:pyruvate carboxylase subunit A
MFKKILVANRGEIAVRIMRACREMGICSSAVFSEADRDALFVKYADESHYIGPAPASQSYLDMQKVIGIALECGADAVHPGYGFLAENPIFAKACIDAGLSFVGPPHRVLEIMGDKVAARREMNRAGVPTVPGSEDCITNIDEARQLARDIGYPVMIKPSGGGGGIGMTLVVSEAELEKALESAQAIARNTFGLSDIYIEKYLCNPRHIEFQILGDASGAIIHLGERECSIQRRHQKLIEESPSPGLTDEIRAAMGAVAVRAGGWVGYQGAGTVEFLYSSGRFYFLEVNARVQVEHPVTEMVTGIDIVKEQIRIASGLPLGIRQEDVRITGSAIECRINAEDPLNGFVPTPGRIKTYYAPDGPGIRVDSGAYGSCSIPPFYDPLIAKVIAWGRDRDEAIRRMERALYEFSISGIETNIPFHRAVMRNSSFVAGDLGTQFIDSETTLADAMRKISESSSSLSERLPQPADKRKIAAAIAAATFAAGMRGEDLG